jgi:hypothetical protein
LTQCEHAIVARGLAARSLEILFRKHNRALSVVECFLATPALVLDAGPSLFAQDAAYSQWKITGLGGAPSLYPRPP